MQVRPCILFIAPSVSSFGIEKLIIILTSEWVLNHSVVEPFQCDIEFQSKASKEWDFGARNPKFRHVLFKGSGKQFHPSWALIHSWSEEPSRSIQLGIAWTKPARSLETFYNYLYVKKVDGWLLIGIQVTKKYVLYFFLVLNMKEGEMITSMYMYFPDFLRITGNQGERGSRIEKMRSSFLREMWQEDGAHHWSQ